MVREVLVEHVLTPILPPTAGLGNGKLVDHTGAQSDQIDVLIFDRTLFPPLIYGREMGLFPVEACLYAIEVKSRTTGPEVADAVTKARSVAKLKYVPEFCINGVPRERVIFSVFGFESNLKSASRGELTRLRKYDSDASWPALSLPNGANLQIPNARLMCVAGRGYWYYGQIRDPATGALSPPGWHGVEPDDPGEEVLLWLAGVSNSLHSFVRQRQGLPFGNYLADSEGAPSSRGSHRSA